MATANIIWLCASVLCFVIVATADDSTEIPSGGCSMEKAFKESLHCGSDIEYQSPRYVPENTLCLSNLGDLCYVCLRHSMVEVDCQNLIQKRQKRGFFKKAFRKLRPKSILRKANPFNRLRPGSFGGFGIFGSGRPFKFNNGFLKGLSGIKWPFIKISKTAPTITCPTVPKVITAPKGKNTVAVRWSAPKVFDKESNIKSTNIVSGKPSGSQFGQGAHSVTYKTIDKTGLSATCSMTFTVKVIRCQSPRAPAHGIVQCSGTVGTVYGSTCTYRCNTGYQLTGAATVTCQNNGAFTKSPTCQKIQCGKLLSPSMATTTSCTDGNRYQSVCVPVCRNGFTPARGARSSCSHNKKWVQTSWKCEDTEKPVFANCPTKKINTIDKTFKWEPLKVTDNSGKVNLTQVQGDPSGSLLKFGVQIIKYVATDTSGNSASCVFVVEVKKMDCPKPNSDDPDMKFMCNGLTANSVCYLSCDSGSFVQGSKYIACVQDETENNTSYWEPVDGEKAMCFKKTCPALSPPKNGALACDKQLGGTVCQIQCDDRYDVAPGEGTTATYVCGKNTHVWKPNSVVPDCSEMAFPEEYFLPTEFFYFLGDCSDQEALREIKQQFIDNLNSIGLSPCMSDACSVDDVDVTCGDAMDANGFNFRRKRRATPNAKRVVHIRLMFHLKNTNRTISPEAAKALLMSLAEKSKDLMSNNTIMRNMLPRPPKPTIPAMSIKPRGRFISHKKTGFAVSSRGHSVLDVARLGIIQHSINIPTVIPPKLRVQSSTGNLTMECSEGYVQPKTKLGTCVPCSVGTYHDHTRATCKPCPVNTYQTEAGSTSCQRCPKHHITLTMGSTRKGDCIALCDKDTFSPTGHEPCYPCPPGHYQPTFGAKTCIPCPESKVKVQGSSKCDNVTTVDSQFKISEFLLTCDNEVCLSF